MWAEARMCPLRLTGIEGDMIDVSDGPFVQDYRTIESLFVGGFYDAGMLAFYACFDDGW
ncbi:hypothetical protein [Aeoliella sp.]|uniref:hypothetical protein n=1 Tax=Aeoliella sp. TaxID=2795800 RepID=UPI003CCB8881